MVHLLGKTTATQIVNYVHAHRQNGSVLWDK